MHPLIKLAKSAVENYIIEGEITSVPENFEKKFLENKSGTFVTIETTTRPPHPPTKGGPLNGELRGCIGTYLPIRKNIAEEIIHNAIAAATEDYRFGPIQKEELPYLSYTVYILQEPELVNPHTTTRIISLLRRRRQSSFGVGVKDISELNPKEIGIIVKTRPIFSSKNLGEQAENDVVFNGHMVAKTGLLLPDLEGVDTIEQQISIACQKGGIDPTKEKIIIYKFEVEKYDK